MDTIPLTLLQDSLTHHTQIRGGLDQKASFLTAISGALFGFSIGHLDEPRFLALMIGALLTVILSVLAVFLPTRSTPKGSGSLICWWGFPGKTYEAYRQAMGSVIASDDATREEYMKEIWTLVNHSIKPKSRYLRLASYTFLLGLVASVALSF
jgi:hypothetical protein